MKLGPDHGSGSCDILRSAKTNRNFVVAQPLDNACYIRLYTRLRLNCARGRIHLLNLDFYFDKLFYISFDSNNNLFWPSNKWFQKVLKIIHDDLMKSVMIFILLFSFASSWIQHVSTVRAASANTESASVNCLNRTDRLVIEIRIYAKQTHP